ncbi:MAG: hypothetical protein QF437_05295 [Planctomycetota bacterium]|jgi:hypothetical protein|nr:hypothetical protein [Planctomycetota bacterium]MDP7129880.1 hypothetical protein [Planctomycetota bacterium]MDP7250467.1 hypothetical protein [Planctomycetota bacterium]
MSVDEIINELHALPRPAKFRVLQTLVSDLAKDEEIDLSEQQAYPVWSPHNAFSAAEQLIKLLEEDSDG